MDGDVEHAVSGDAAALPDDADATGLALSRPTAYQYPAYDGRAAFQYLWTPRASHGPNAHRDRGRRCHHPPRKFAPARGTHPQSPFVHAGRRRAWLFLGGVSRGGGPFTAVLLRTLRWTGTL